MVGRRIGIALLLLGLSAQANAGAAGDDAVPVLYLADKEEHASYYNFTSIAPDAGATGQAIQPIQTQFRASHTWRVFKLPAPWLLEEGAAARLVLYVQGIDQLYPLPDVRPEDIGDVETPVPETDPQAVGKIAITAQLLQNGDVGSVLARARTYHIIDPMVPEQTVRRLEMELPYKGQALAVNPETPSGVTLLVEVSGRNVTNISPLRFLVGSTETASRLTAPGFPIDAFRTAEEALAVERACLRASLQANSCTPELQAADIAEASAGPDVARAAGAYVLFAAALAAGVVKRRATRGAA